MRAGWGASTPTTRSVSIDGSVRSSWASTAAARSVMPTRSPASFPRGRRRRRAIGRLIPPPAWGLAALPPTSSHRCRRRPRPPRRRRPTQRASSSAASPLRTCCPSGLSRRSETRGATRAPRSSSSSSKYCCSGCSQPEAKRRGGESWREPRARAQPGPRRRAFEIREQAISLLRERLSCPAAQLGVPRPAQSAGTRAGKLGHVRPCGDVLHISGMWQAGSRREGLLFEPEARELRVRRQVGAA